MPERVFTIFQGPDAGRTFVLGESPLTLGRDGERDIVLNDDRASRLHARLLPDGDGAIVVDAGSSNGTFVNGLLIRERRVVPGDVIAIGANCFVFGSEVPSSRGTDGIVMPAAAPTRAPESSPAPPPTWAPAHLTELLEAVADAAQPAADARGIHLSIEAALTPDDVWVDAQQFYRALAGLLAHFLEMWPARPEPRTEAIVARVVTLRSSADPVRAGFQAEMICAGMPAPREQICAVREADAVASARRTAVAHGGALELLPQDSPGTLVRLRMPLGRPDALRTVLHGP